VEEKMVKKRKRHSAEFKFKVALAAAKESETVNHIASEHSLHPSQVSQWKQQLLSEGGSLFASGPKRAEQDQAKREAELYEQIGRLKMELEWLKKKAAPFS
jgi:putative transposase